jgi:hypothetical protein
VAGESSEAHFKNRVAGPGWEGTVRLTRQVLIYVPEGF